MQFWSGILPFDLQSSIADSMSAGSHPLTLTTSRLYLFPISMRACFMYGWGPRNPTVSLPDTAEIMVVRPRCGKGGHLLGIKHQFQRRKSTNNTAKLYLHGYLETVSAILSTSAYDLAVFLSFIHWERTSSFLRFLFFTPSRNLQTILCCILAVSNSP